MQHKSAAARSSRAYTDGRFHAEQGITMNHTINPLAAEEFETLGDVIEAMYRSVSGPVRGIDLELQNKVFAPNARLIRAGVDEEGNVWRQDMSLDDYEEDTRGFLGSTDFYEYETARKVMHCPPFAYVLSEYEAKSDPDSDELILSGVNSIQCLFDGKRWWVQQLTWNHRA